MTSPVALSEPKPHERLWWNSKSPHVGNRLLYWTSGQPDWIYICVTSVLRKHLAELSFEHVAIQENRSSLLSSD